MTSKVGRSRDWLAGGHREDISRERIVAAAVELVRERGFDSVQPEEVAARAGCSRATLYRHVGGKEAIRDAIIMHVSVAIAQRITEAVSGFDGAQRVVETVLVAASAVREEPIVKDALKQPGNDLVVRYITSPAMVALVLQGCDLDPSDTVAGHAILRASWSLAQTPLGDPALERQLIERFVGSVFR